METNLLRRVYINGDPERLPKEKGDYFAHDKDTPDWSLHKNFYVSTTSIKRNWMTSIDYYLVPVSREEIIEIVKSKISGLSTKDYIAEKIADEIIGGK